MQFNNVSIFVHKINSKKNNWRYEIRYKDKGGTTHRVTKQGFDTKKSAILHAQNASNKLMTQTEIYTDYTSLGEVWDSYIDELKIKGASHNTIYVKNMAKSFFKDLCPKPIASIKPLDIQSTIDQSSLSIASAKLYLSALNGAFKKAKDLEVITTNPVQNVKIFKKVEVKKETVILSKDEIINLYHFLSEHNTTYALISLIQGTCGLRFGEVFGIKYTDIKDNMLNVNNQSKGMILKTTNSYRTVPVPPFTINAIKQYKKENLHFNGYLFGEINQSSTNMMLNRKLKEFKKGLSTHKLRHSYGSNLIVDGIDMPTVAHLMGDKLETIQNVYIHVTDKGKEKAIEWAKNY